MRLRDDWNEREFWDESRMKVKVLTISLPQRLEDGAVCPECEETGKWFSQEVMYVGGRQTLRIACDCGLYEREEEVS